MKIFIDEIPVGIGEKTYERIKKSGFNSMAISDTILVSQLIKSSSLYFSKYEIAIRVTGDDATLNSLENELKLKPFITYPMKSKGFMTFYETEMWFKFQVKSDLSIITSYWGQGVWFEFYFTNQLDSLMQYVNTHERQSFDKMLAFADLFYRQSGDDDEIEILFKKKDFNLLEKQIYNYIFNAILSAS